MEANTGRAETGFRRIGRLLLVLASFLGAFAVISRAMILFGVNSTEANAAGLICGLAVMAFVKHLPRRF